MDRISLRDHFAGCALQGLLAGLAGNVSALQSAAVKRLVETAYQLADEMITHAGPPAVPDQTAPLH